MLNETRLDGGQQSVEQPRTLDAAAQSRAAFSGEFQDTIMSGWKFNPVVNLDLAYLPKVESFDPHHAPPAASPGRISDSNDLANRIVKTIGFNEGAFTHINSNDNGHGISVGIRQWNQKVGELPNLLKAMHDQNPKKFDATFGAYSKDLLHENWVKNTDMAGNQDLMRRMNKAVHDPEFQKVQMDKAKSFAERAIETARHLGIKTEKGACLVADVINQLGEGGARRVFRRAGLRADHPIEDEQAMLHRVEHLSRRPNSKARFATVASNFNDGALIAGHIVT